MKLVENRGFRIFLYILGYISCAAVILLSVLTYMRYTTFENDIGTAAAYAETENIRSIVDFQIGSMEEIARNRAEWESSDIMDLAIDVYDYDAGKREAVTIEEMSGKQGTDDILAGLKDAAYFFGYSTDDTYVYSPKTPVYGGFVRIRTDAYQKLVASCAQRFFQNDINDLSDAGVTSVLADLSGGRVTLYDGDYYSILADGLFIYSPAEMRIQVADAADVRTYYLGRDSGVLYIGVSMDAFSSGSRQDDDQLAETVFSGVVYQSPFEAFYSLLPEEQQDLISRINSENNGAFYYSNAAWSAGNNKVTDMKIYDWRGFAGTVSDQAFANDYTALADRIADNADVCVRFDKDAGSLEQWYRDDSGGIRHFTYIEDIKSLTQLSESSFVFGMKLYDSYYEKFSFESNIFLLCRDISSPPLLLVICIVIFAACVILLLAGAPAKQRFPDTVPFELALVGYFVLLFIFAFFLPREYINSILLLLKKDLAAGAAVILLWILILYIITAGIFMTVARRVRCRSFLQGLLCVKFAKLLYRIGCKVTSAYREALCGHKRLTVFLTVLFAVNALALLVLAGHTGRGWILAGALILLAAEGFAGYRLLKYSAGVEKVLRVSRSIENGDLQAKTDPGALSYNIRELGVSLNNIGTGLSKAVESSIRDERTKAELITNVSHDIKTPLTSIISYVDLLKGVPIENESAKEYIRVLDQKAQRLKQLIMDLIEVSKTGTGNIELERINLDLSELLEQALGEYEEKMAACGLIPVKTVHTADAVIFADGRRMFRIIDNILENVVKYAQNGTRVYIDLDEQNDMSGRRFVLSVKNVSREMLNISAEELTERFVRGDRSRHTEGSGLGLSIAKNLTELQGGTFRIEIDGDLFKVELTFPAV